MQHKKKWVIPDKPAVLVLQRKNITFLGTETRQVVELDKKAKVGNMQLRAGRIYTGRSGRSQGMEVCTPTYSSIVPLSLSHLLESRYHNIAVLILTKQVRRKIFLGCTGWLRESVMERVLLTQMPGQTAGAWERLQRLTGTHVKRQTTQCASPSFLKIHDGLAH